MAHLLLHHRCHHCFLLDLDLRVCSGSCRWVIWHLIARTINVPHSLLAALQLAASLWCATRGCGLALPRFITMQHDQECSVTFHISLHRTQIGGLRPAALLCGRGTSRGGVYVAARMYIESGTAIDRGKVCAVSVPYR